MTPDEKFFSALPKFEPPVLILSTHVGRGMYTLGEAFAQRLPADWEVHHHPIEEFLPSAAVGEDVRRYRFIISRVPVLLYLMYRVPIFYYRKWLRETRGRQTDLSALHAKAVAMGARTIVCISHRPGFWTTLMKRRTKLDVPVWGVLGEYGSSLGWRYIGWPEMDGYFSPLPKATLDLPFPAHVRFVPIELPARLPYYEVAKQPGGHGKVLIIGGYWGTGPLRTVIHEVAAAMPALQITVICGDNEPLQAELQQAFAGNRNVRIVGKVDSLVPWLAETGSVITKPGISTTLEGHAASRKMFLLDGAPVAEEHNARFALARWGAERYSLAAFRAWHEAPEKSGPLPAASPAMVLEAIPA